MSDRFWVLCLTASSTKTPDNGERVITLNGILAISIIIVTIGKHTGRVRWTAYSIIALLALIEAAIVLYDMFALTEPAI